MKMIEKIVFVLKKSLRPVGTSYYNKFSNIKGVFEETRKLIDNYNSNLISLKIPEEILVLRFFQKQNIDGSLETEFPFVMDNTYVFLDNVYGDNYEIITSIDENSPKIGISNKDYFENIENGTWFIEINLDSREVTINMNLFFNDKLYNNFMFNEISDVIDACNNGMEIRED